MKQKSTSHSISRAGCASYILCGRDDVGIVPYIFWGRYAYFFSASSTATATETAAPPWVSSSFMDESGSKNTNRVRSKNQRNATQGVPYGVYTVKQRKAHPTRSLRQDVLLVVCAGGTMWASSPTLLWGEGRLFLQRFLNSNSHTDSSANHGVVAHAQEAHHFHVKSALRRLCGDFSRAFGAVSPTFRKTRDTSIVSIGCAFLTETHLITSFVHETRSFD